jgi:hypothetical protein
MAESYLFNPTEGINRAASQVQANLGSIFTGIIAQKQNDYNIAEKTFENINALTDKLGEYGQEEITSKTQTLLDSAAKSIIKNGKVDYAEIGKIRNGVNSIKNRKSALEAGTQMYKELAQTALATKDDLLNLGVTLDGMRSVILNPENLSAEDMGRQMQSVYQKNINTTKVMSDVFSRIAPKGDFAETYTHPDKGQYAISGTKITGWELDPVTNKWTPPASVPVKNPDGTLALNPDGTPKTQSYLEAMTSAVKQQGAPAIAAIRAQMGENSVFQTDEQIVNNYLQQYIQNNNVIQKDLQIKSKDELDMSKYKAGAAELELKAMPEKIRLEQATANANLGLIGAKTRGANLENALTEGAMSDTAPLADLGIRVTSTAKDVDLGKTVKMNSISWNGKHVPFLATNLGYDKKTGRYVISGYPNPKSVEGKWEAGDTDLVAIPVSESSRSYINFNSAVNAQTDKVKAALRTRLKKFHSIQVGAQQQAAAQEGGGAPAATNIAEGFDAASKTLFVSRSRGADVYNKIAKEKGAKHIRFID